MNEDMLNYVKGKLEEGEGISPAALTRILAAARHDNLLSHACCPPTALAKRKSLLSYACCLLAASLTIMAGGWLFLSSTHPTTRDNNRDADLANVIDLLRITDGDTTTTTSTSLADNLLAWQDAPTVSSDEN